jgi:lipopolysaccharide assembly outer membrane protein LptD (OstA)
MFILKKITIIVILLLSIQGFSQSKKIKILKADNTYTDKDYPGAIISLGNVFVEHEGATLRCDQARIYQEKNFLQAFGNVIINQGDTVMQYSKYTDYDANKKLATSWGDVVLEDELMTLKTDTLYFDRVNQHLYYKSGGTIRDTANFLKSKFGNYYLKTNKFQAETKVDVTNKDGSTLISDHLDYYTSTGIAELFGPSTITNTENKIYTEKGHHNTKTNISHFIKNSIIYYSDRIIKGDSLYYNKNTEFASATGNIEVIDTVNSSTIKGGYAELFKLKDSMYITNEAVAISEVAKNDSIYIHGDTLLITGKIEERLVKAFRGVKIFKADLQGKCDSLVSNEKSGVTKLFLSPVLWAEGNQITGDTIHLISNTKTEQLDSLKILGNAFMIQKDSAGFSQLKGRNMYGKFKNNKLESLNDVGNSEVLWYLRDENQKLLGITNMRASKNIFITMANNELTSIKFFDKPEGKTYPPSKFPEDKSKLDAFIWREDERPLTNKDIFINDIKVIEKEKTSKETSKKEN